MENLADDVSAMTSGAEARRLERKSLFKKSRVRLKASTIDAYLVEAGTGGL